MKILVPTDFSDSAINATRAAADIARKTNAELILLHIIELPQEGTDAVQQGFEIPEIMFFKQQTLQSNPEHITKSQVHFGV